MNGKLPAPWVEKHKGLMSGAIFMGRKIDHMTKPELLAIIAYYHRREKERDVEFSRRMGVLLT